MRRTVTLASTIGALLGAGLVPAPAFADRAECPTKLENSYSAHYYSVAKKFTKRTPGRNIRKYGVLRHKRVRDASCHELRVSRRQLIQLKAPPPHRPLLVRTAVPPRQAPAGVKTASVAAAPNGALAAIAQCESGGNPQAVNPNGHYGKYQFDLQTWQSVGGSGNPAAASEAEQDQRAAALYAQRGGSPWACAR